LSMLLVFWNLRMVAWSKLAMLNRRTYDRVRVAMNSS
jgi:hypothetical protein